MASLYYNLYCDESGTNGSTFFFGALHCSRARAEILDKKIQDLRALTGLTHEMKWAKVSKSYLHYYKRFVDIFLDDKYGTFYLYSVNKSRDWAVSNSTKDVQFLNSYSCFLRSIMWCDARYSIVMDEGIGKNYRVNSFNFCLKRLKTYSGYQKKVYSVAQVNSHHNNLVQLCDVVLGGLTSQAESSHKVELSE